MTLRGTALLAERNLNETDVGINAVVDPIETNRSIASNAETTNSSKTTSKKNSKKEKKTAGKEEREEGGDIKGDDSNKTVKEKEAKVEDDICVDSANYTFEGNDEKDCNWAKEKRILKCKRVDKKTEKPISFHCPSVCNDACRDIAAPSVDSKTTVEKKGKGSEQRKER